MFGIIVNPRAKKNLTGKFQPERLEGILGGRGIVRASDSLNSLEGIFQEFFDRGVEVFCFSGGDGTQHLTTDALIHFCRERKYDLPILHPIRGGVMNMVANEMSTYRGNPATQCRALAACPRPGHPGKYPCQSRPILRVEDPELSRETYAYTLADGVLFKGLDDYNRGPRNVRAAFNLAVRIIGGAAAGNHWSVPTPARISADGKELPFGENLLTVAAAVRKLVLWFSPFPPSPPPDGGFYALCCALSPGELVRHLPSYSRGKRRHERLFNQPVRELIIEGQGGYVLDGEVHYRPRGFRARITAGPELRFLKMAEGGEPGSKGF